MSAKIQLSCSAIACAIILIAAPILPLGISLKAFYMMAALVIIGPSIGVGVMHYVLRN